MIILGDIGNTETKIWLVSKKSKILKKIFFSSKEITNNKLSKVFKKNDPRRIFNLGKKNFTCYTMDFTKKYLEINSDYRT